MANDCHIIPWWVSVRVCCGTPNLARRQTSFRSRQSQVFGCFWGVPAVWLLKHPDCQWWTITRSSFGGTPLHSWYTLEHVGTDGTSADRLGLVPLYCYRNRRPGHPLVVLDSLVKLVSAVCTDSISWIRCWGVKDVVCKRLAKCCQKMTWVPTHLLVCKIGM